MRRAAELRWPALLVGATCVGIVAAGWVRLPAWVLPVLVLTGVFGVVLTDGLARVAALGGILLVAGMWWGGLRLDAVRETSPRAR